MYQLTSGSTGTPKAVRLTHANILANSNALFTATEGDTGHRCDGQLAAVVARHGHTRVPCAADAVRHRARRVQARGVPAPTGAVGGPDRPLPRNHHLGTELRLCAARLDSRTGRTRPLRSVQPARGDQRRRPIDARDTSRLAEAGARFGLRPGAVTPAYGMAEATLAITFDNSPQVTVDRISRSDLQERALATPDAGADACGVVSVVSRWQAWRSASSYRSRPCPPRQSGRSRSAVAAMSRGYLTEYGWCVGAIRDGWLRPGTSATSANTAGCTSAAAPRT